MQKLILNDGTELENSYACETLENLFLYIKNGMNMMQVFMLLYDPNKTDRIIYTSGDMTSEYTGFTVVQTIDTGVGGLVCATMRRNAVS